MELSHTTHHLRRPIFKALNLFFENALIFAVTIGFLSSDNTSAGQISLAQIIPGIPGFHRQWLENDQSFYDQTTQIWQSTPAASTNTTVKFKRFSSIYYQNSSVKCAKYLQKNRFQCVLRIPDASTLHQQIS